MCDGEDGGDIGGGFSDVPSWSPVGNSPAGSQYDAYTALKSTNDPLVVYEQTASKLEASISASAAPTEAKTLGNLTGFVGISGSAVTPLGGAEVDLGFYSDSYGMIGAYFSLGPAMGIPSASIAAVSGHTRSLSGGSVGVSGGLGWGMGGISKGYSFDPSSGQPTGDSWALGLSVGPPVSASASFTSTTTSEFTSLYLVYIQFLNSVGYPGNGSSGYSGYWQ